MAPNGRKVQTRVLIGRRDVLRELHGGGPRTAREITASLARINPAYTEGIVGDRLRELQDERLVKLGNANAVGLWDGGASAGTGRPPLYATLTDRWGLGLGVEIGRSLIRAAVVDPSGTLLARDAQRREAMRLGPTLQQTAAIANALLATIAREHAQPVVGVTIAVSAPIDREQQAVVGGLLPDWEMEALDVRFADLLTTDARVSIVNDADARALGEGRFGLARAAHSAFVLKVSGGIGGALLRRGTVLDGVSGLAGEIGHLGVSLDALARPPVSLRLPPLDPDAVCSCQDAGGRHLEAYASTSAIARRVSAARGAEVAFETIAAEWRTRADARRAVVDAARLLGLGVAAVMILFDPQIVVVRGRFATAGDDAVASVRNVLSATRPFRHRLPRVLVAVPQRGDGAHNREFDWIGARGAGRHAIELGSSADDPPT